MPYTDPQSGHNPTTGQVIPASWGDAVRDAEEYLARNKPHCRIRNTANISVPNATDTALTFNSERVDVGGMHSTGSNTSRITVPASEGGFYLMGGGVQVASNATGHRQVGIRLNGSTFLVASRVAAATSGATVMAVSTGYQLAAGDYLELVVTQDSGGALNAEAGGNYTPEFWALWTAV